MKKNSIIILSAFLATAAVSCASHSSESPAEEPKTQEPAKETDTKQADNAEAVIYTCPMHPEVTSDKEGTCPKCGMKLEIKK